MPGQELERQDSPKAYRAYVRQVLVGTAGRDEGDDPQAWRAFWEKAGGLALEKEEARRDVQRLARPQGYLGARERLLKRGRSAVRALMDGLQESAAQDAPEEAVARAARIRTECADLLREITGKDFGTDRAAWDRWWREQGEGS